VVNGLKTAQYFRAASARSAEWMSLGYLATAEARRGIGPRNSLSAVPTGAAAVGGAPVTAAGHSRRRPEVRW